MSVVKDSSSFRHVLVARPLRADWQVLAAQCDHHPDDDYFPRVGVLSQFMSAVERQRLFHNTVRLIGGASNHVKAQTSTTTRGSVTRAARAWCLRAEQLLGRFGAVVHLPDRFLATHSDPWSVKVSHSLS